MIEETLRVLEYDKIKQLLAGFTVTVPGRMLVEALAPLPAAEQVAESLAQITEMCALIGQQGSPPVGGSSDLRELLRHLRAEGTWLQPEALLEVLASAEAAHQCRGYFGGRERAPRLGALAEGLDGLKELRRAVRESIGARGEILDGASFELGEIRQRLLQLRARIKRSLEALLNSERLAGAFQDRIITERGGRYVVPVRADHRGQVKGFIHDESASGQTLYVEPVSVLEWNNELQTQLREEKREEERILRRLSGQVRVEAEPLAGNQRILGRLDFVAAAARFSLASDGVAPRLVEQPLVELKAARHPLLLFNADGTARQGEAIPVDLLLGEGIDTLVISGPNTGGKTVALKTLGLLTLLVRSGLHIPCHPDSRVGRFARVFADIGDEQSIEENLSTFSGHLTRIGRILREADGESLVLLDEAGTGTDPAEGGALAMAVLDSLRARGARTVVTTHLNLVKGYAHLQARVENAAVEFDSQTLAPTYRLHYGIPGASSAFTIARRLGLPEEVLARAEGYLGSDQREGLEVLERLNRLSRELEADRAEAATLRERARQERDKRKRLLEEFEEQKRGILAKATRRGEQLVREAEGKIKELLRQAREGVEVQQQARMVGELREVGESLAEKRPEPRRQGQVPRETRVGEILRITSLGTEGEVVRVQGSEVELSVLGKKLRLPLEQLEQFRPRRFAGKRPAGRVRSSVERGGFNPRLLLIGKRAEEALLLLDRFLDDALLANQRQVEVVHGAGEGILRKAVREYLAGHREVRAFHAADVAQGGDNVTVVELRGA
ncbi:endonuclease MutS2 [Desulfuromonas versatilis]|uniref:Endonuclease MutS2 n=1 Tax=Desulfuromonas versatilis TaxID=2802975 RepID=A0ABM8HVY7_9BACT|nr:endonuclease MutS2 [Desulfuromonas versatilis]BCR06495.1 endonuclease MutS2 [Desulfuromonas versatilis]